MAQTAETIPYAERKKGERGDEGDYTDMKTAEGEVVGNAYFTELLPDVRIEP